MKNMLSIKGAQNDEYFVGNEIHWKMAIQLEYLFHIIFVLKFSFIIIDGKYVIMALE